MGTRKTASKDTLLSSLMDCASAVQSVGNKHLRPSVVNRFLSVCSMEGDLFTDRDEASLVSAFNDLTAQVKTLQGFV